jgi:hypothetical protein
VPGFEGKAGYGRDDLSEPGIQPEIGRQGAQPLDDRLGRCL